MFNHFLDTRQTNSQDAIDKCSITYLGESFPLALVLEDLREGGRTRLHHPGPPIESPETVQHVDGILNHPPHLLQEDITFLEAKHVFEYPPPDVYDALIEVFLNTFLPIYSIVHRPEFEDHYRQKKLPWIIVHSCCFIATTFCTDVLIHRAGFAARKDARYAYYSKAKVLFDTNYERNKIVVLQSTLMLTFWGGGPNDYWNTWSWISAAVTIAETLGIHRSTLGANMSTKDRSLLKRLWWTLVVRDASCSTLVGRPFRINMEHGDAEMLTLQDFEVDAHILETADHPLKISFADYQIQVARLSLLLYDIDYARFIPGPKALSMSQVYDRLQAWKNDLPMAVDWDQSSDLLATCLSMMYDHHLMLASLGVSGSEVAAGGSHTNGVQLPFAELAAQRVSTQASAIIMKNQSLMVPHETYQPVFVAGVVSYMSMRSSQTTQSQLGRFVVDNCRMVLHSVRDAWDAAPWIITLFDGLTISVNASRAQEHGEAHTMDMGRTPGDLSAFMGDLDESTMGFGMPASWQSNPMFSALFDVSQPMDGFGSGIIAPQTTAAASSDDLGDDSRQERKAEGGVSKQGEDHLRSTHKMDPKLIDCIASARAIVDRQAASFQQASPSPPALAPTFAVWDTRASTLPPATEPLITTPAAPFRPLFALIIDPLSGEIHHPTIHYVFADDEPDGSPLTAAALQAIEDHEDTTLHGTDEPEQRVVVVDLQGDGRTVAGVTSLSEAFQGLRTEVGTAPSWGAGKGDGVMINIAGNTGHADTAGNDRTSQGLGALVERFEAGMERLGVVMGGEDDKSAGAL
ncbi:hypothetical protein B0A48_13306 [Cryoendolithus antarcticus]|uniref:Xylanolytic transcriptional activator regulatory domain-containing protein n=1 Tax=Cryoendolithus antarcticus TaxID=1507870 RepID=A0A1V8SPJ4_9PEZI|nr:hypothetical protein B0A48_13306 [Cryoendolithus antarcticus]